jgi:hypothetical protein
MSIEKYIAQRFHDPNDNGGSAPTLEDAAAKLPPAGIDAALQAEIDAPETDKGAGAKLATETAKDLETKAAPSVADQEAITAEAEKNPDLKAALNEAIKNKDWTKVKELRAKAAEQKPAEEKEKPAGEQGLLAGRYKTGADLKKGALELATKLKMQGASTSALNRLIAAAEKTNDWTDVEATYKELQSEFTKQSDNQKPPASPNAPATQDTKGTDTLPPEVEAKINRFVTGEIELGLMSHPIARDFKRLGIELPRTSEELDALKGERETYNLAIAFENAVLQLAAPARQFAEGHYRTELIAPTLLEKEKGDVTKHIEDTAKKYGVTIPPEKLASMIDAITKSEDAYTIRNGVKVPKEGGFTRAFNAEYLPQLLEDIALNAKVSGAQNHAEVLRTLAKKTAGTISTAGGGGQRPAEKESITERARKGDASLTQEQIDRQIERELA